MLNYLISSTFLVILNLYERSNFFLQDIMTVFILHLILTPNPPPSLKDAELEYTLLNNTQCLFHSITFSPISVYCSRTNQETAYSLLSTLAFCSQNECSTSAVIKLP